MKICGVFPLETRVKLSLATGASTGSCVQALTHDSIQEAQHRKHERERHLLSLRTRSAASFVGGDREQVPQTVRLRGDGRQEQPTARAASTSLRTTILGSSQDLPYQLDRAAKTSVQQQYWCNYTTKDAHRRVLKVRSCSFGSPTVTERACTVLLD